MTKYKITDKQGNALFNGKVFDSFIDTWNFMDKLERGTLKEADYIEGMDLVAMPLNQ